MKSSSLFTLKKMVLDEMFHYLLSERSDLDSCSNMVKIRWMRLSVCRDGARNLIHGIAVVDESRTSDKLTAAV